MQLHPAHDGIRPGPGRPDQERHRRQRRLLSLRRQVPAGRPEEVPGRADQDCPEHDARLEPRPPQALQHGRPADDPPINICTSVLIPSWSAGSITLLGDATHTMTPGQGVGANTSLRDAARLCSGLIRCVRGDTTLLEAIDAYKEKMVRYGF
ncbi:FAD-dependent oxidoreductase [Streptomyces chrestomyceticus]|uniref:FAD-dependent oxidoreductase n=1 Tax=Streptomyces chrestomyceticus TaxID=68185 RepID=UPI0035A91ABF